MVFSAHAWVNVDDIYYNIENGAAFVTYGEDKYDTSRYTGDISIPESIMVGNIPYQVTGIDKSAFSSCSQLTSVILPNSISFIGENAFSSSGLRSFAIPNSVATIGENAFGNCTELLELSIDPNPDLYIGANAFKLCSNLMYVKTTDIAKWCGIRFETCTSNPCVGGLGTLYLGAKKITSLEIPEGVTEIKDCTFAGCDFTSVALPSSITSIGDYAFIFCSKLTGITIPNSVKTIGNFAFSNCSSLHSPNIYIPNSVTSIGKSAFSNCTSLSDISFWPKSVATIGEYTFSSCLGLESVGLPEGIKSISNGAFYNCTNLTSIIVPESLTFLSLSAFESCQNIAAVEWNAISCKDYVFEKKEYSDEYVDGPPRSPFADSRMNLHSFTIGHHVNTIPAYLCYDIQQLYRLIFPNSIKAIGDYAFCVCIIRDEISFGNSLESIGKKAFCKSFAYPFFSGISDIVIPNSVTSIGDYAFAYGKVLKNVTLGNSVVSIGDAAFRDCSGLTRVSLPLSLQIIGDGAFANCRVLTDISLPLSLQAIGESAFGGCSGLTTINIPNSVKTIGNYAFYNCRNVVFIGLGNSVESIGEEAFKGCDLITHMSIPASVKSMGRNPFPATLTTIEWNAINCSNNTSAVNDYSPYFSNCTLTSITFGNRVEHIPYNICRNQSGLTEIVFPASVKTMGATPLGECSGLQKIMSFIKEPKTVVLGLTDEQYKQLPLYIPKGTTDAYLNALGWADFLSIIEMPGGGKGDLNGDEVVDDGDESILLQVVLTDGITDEQKAIADLNGDGDVDGTDVSILLEIVLAGE